MSEDEHQFPPIEESSEEDDPIMVPLKQMRREMQHFNNNRKVSHYHKMRELLKGDKRLKKKHDLDTFIEKQGGRAGILCKDENNSEIDKVNASILFLEEIFEAKKKRTIQRPCDKEQVMDYIKNCLAQPGFLTHLKKQQHKIDRQLKQDEDYFQEEMRRLSREERNHLLQ